MHLKSLHKLTISIYSKKFTSVVYSENGLKVKKSSKTTDTMNGTILFDATNQNPASICKSHVTVPSPGSAIITESQAVH